MKLPDTIRKILRFQEDAYYILPSALASIVFFTVIIIESILGNQEPANQRIFVSAIGIGGSFYILIQSMLIVPRIKKHKNYYFWANAAISGIGLSLLVFALDDAHHTFYSILLILSVISIAILSDRGPTYLLIALSGIFYILLHRDNLNGFLAWAIHTIPIIASIVITETILRLRYATQDHIRRLEIVNAFSQQINSTLNTEDVFFILNKALQKSLKADTYYVGLLDNENIRLELFYDDGEYFSGVQVAKRGTLSGWVIENQKPLFLTDLRNDVQLEGVQQVIIGKDKTSLSWMGVPMKTTHINGVLGVASYKANEFTPSDMELLSNLAQHAALALDNTFHHKQVEEQSRLDSLTNTYNHRFFLKALQELIDTAGSRHQGVSLIMLDIDFFKSYNDSFGHQVGDLVLIELCETIRKNIKKGDFVGRWGGEEFAIALPGANGEEAHQVALRIQRTMQTLVLNDLKNQNIPTPTVSQGISEFPDETDKLDRFIYLADQRLYKAKERGRNQIEPDESHWEKFKTSTKKQGASKS